ncbi:hypothetical protein [Nocardiopsis sp. RV163]|uniref:hypothetical protein n=1 Tax=Nocardiopsis sp. RV163 TaxID=1661388 RepID=UPI00064C1513|nr:hypothetical protein [Nocardiopsis sp. RV163]
MTHGLRWSAAALTAMGVVIVTDFARPVLTLPGGLALALVAAALPWWQWAVGTGRMKGTPRMWLCGVALPFVAVAGFLGVTARTGDLAGEVFGAMVCTLVFIPAVITATTECQDMQRET